MGYVILFMQHVYDLWLLGFTWTGCLVLYIDTFDLLRLVVWRLLGV